MKYCDIKLKMSTSRHPQTDGATEIMNHMIGNYLRCYCGFNQDYWDKLLTTAEFAYNSAKVESLKMSPFEMDLGWLPKSPLELLARSPDDSIQTLNDFKVQESFRNAKFAQRIAQARSKHITVTNTKQLLTKLETRSI